MNPYITYQDPKKLFATTQGTAMQDQYNAQALQQMGQLAGQAGQTAPVQGSNNALALASMLRKTQPTSNTDFLTGNYTAPSVGMNPNANIGYNIDSMSGYGLK
jgi:Tfp pilus assembly protein PilW